ncbi:acyl-CoA-binding domain-containing protein 4 isoform 2-T4 [Menidia menidia]
MPVPVMAQPLTSHQERFQAAVDVIHNLPKNGSFRPSYAAMLRFYSLYKQAVCGPCTVPRPGFWDPVGRYKWDAWNSLGDMSPDSAMAAYVEELKKVAQEVIDSVPMNDTTASFFHHFEPLYRVIEDMPRPPASLLLLTVKGSQYPDEEEGQQASKEIPEEPDPKDGFNVTASTGVSIPNDSGVSESLLLTSDSESEIFCDSVDSVEQLHSIKIPVIKSNGFHNGHLSAEPPLGQSCERHGRLEGRQAGAGQGGEGAEDGKGHGPGRRRPDTDRGGSHHNWRERGVPQGNPRGGAAGSGGGARRGGGDGSEGGADRLHDGHLQQQIVLALQRLRQDMRSVMDRLEVVERLAATHAHGSEWRPCPQCSAAASQKEETWWPFDVSGQTVLLFLLWPFVTHGLVYLLRKAHQRSRMSS